MTNKDFYVVIIAGGIGSRFWPESRAHFPKQFLDILDTGQSLIQTTYQRLEALCPSENIFIVTHKDYLNLMQEHLPEVNRANIILEPFRKNTAPAAAYISYKIQNLNPQANILMCPSDHLIINELNFIKTAQQALNHVKNNNHIVTLGIQPTRPDTGYGYIQYNNEEERSTTAYKVKTFTEKPDLELARTFLKSGDFLWNSGMFVWNISTIIEAFELYLPDLADMFKRISDKLNTEHETDVIEKLYSQCKKISIDYGIMEKASNVYVIPSNFGWTDLGTWASVFYLKEKNRDNNLLSSDRILAVDVNNSLIKIPKDKLAVVQGLDNYLIVDTPDVLLICDKNKEQEVKNYVSEIKKNFGDQYT